jgi:Xaa-Pro aminopeptidase
MTTENVGESFQEDLFLAARTKAWILCAELAAQAKPGMREADLKSCLETLAKNAGVEKWWHPIKIRFGQNTLCSFRDPSDDQVTLKDEDYFFIDIGPVFSNHEGDVGQTYFLKNGKIQRDFKNPAQVVFLKLKELWEKEGITGRELYERACLLSGELGFEFNTKMAGHRLSDFPHALHHKGSLKDFEKRPKEQRWILEVHLLKKENEPVESRGFFFEDLLK